MLNVGILTISDKGYRGERTDESGTAIREVVSRIGGRVVHYEIVPDEVPAIAGRLAAWADEGTTDLVITTGGTGLSARDVTPEATMSVVDKVVPGIGEAMRAATASRSPYAILSRATAGVRQKTLIVNVPGSPTGATECLEAVLDVLEHACDIVSGRVTEHRSAAHHH